MIRHPLLLCSGIAGTILCHLLACAHPEDDPQSLVGKAWTGIRPAFCNGETLVEAKRPLRSYAVLSWKGRLLLVYRDGKPIFGMTRTADPGTGGAEREPESSRVLGVIDLGAFDWKTDVISGSVFDPVICRTREAGDSDEQGTLVVATAKLEKVSDEDFAADRAWKWNDASARFDRVADLTRVTCSFDTQGDITVGDFQDGWPDWGWPNYQCEAETP